MTYAPVNGLQLYYETHGSGRPLVLLHGGLQTIDLSFGPLLKPLAASRHVIAVELQGHGHTADTDRPMSIEALADDIIALLDHLGIAAADFYGFSLGGLVACAVALAAPARVGQLIAASADAHRPPGRESPALGEDRLPTLADFEEWREAYHAVAPDPAHFFELQAKTSAAVHGSGVDRRAALPSGADPAAVRRPGLHAVAGRGGDVPAPAERATRGAPRGHPHGRQPTRRRSARVDHAVSRRALTPGRGGRGRRHRSAGYRLPATTGRPAASHAA